LAQTVSADEFADVQAQLSKDFARLLPRDPAVEVRRWRCCWTGSRTRPTATCDLDAGRCCLGVVRGCPVGTDKDRCEWHASGTAAEDDPGIRLRRGSTLTKR
jgi:hypothetical protein